MDCIQGSIPMTSTIKCDSWRQGLRGDGRLPATRTSFTGGCFWQASVSYCKWVTVPITHLWAWPLAQGSRDPCPLHMCTLLLENHSYSPSRVHWLPAHQYVALPCMWLTIIRFQLPSDAEIHTITAWPVRLHQSCSERVLIHSFVFLKGHGNNSIWTC